MSIQRIAAGRGHWYKVDGEKADGVTTLIKEGVPKPALINWAGNVTAAYAVDHWAELSELKPSERLKTLQGCRWADRDEAAHRGTEVHALGERLARHEEVDVPDELAGHVESYVAFLDEWQPKAVLLETTVANRKWNYAGTLDAVFDLPDGRRVLADLKTARSGIFLEASLQMAAYAHAEVYLDDDGTEQPMPELHAGIGIHVRADGYDVHPINIGERPWRIFCHAAWLARQLRDATTLIGDPQ